MCFHGVAVPFIYKCNCVLKCKELRHTQYQPFLHYAFPAWLEASCFFGHASGRHKACWSKFNTWCTPLKSTVCRAQRCHCHALSVKVVRLSRGCLTKGYVIIKCIYVCPQNDTNEMSNKVCDTMSVYKKTEGKPTKPICQ